MQTCPGNQWQCHRGDVTQRFLDSWGFPFRLVNCNGRDASFGCIATPAPGSRVRVVHLTDSFAVGFCFTNLRRRFAASQVGVVRSFDCAQLLLFFLFLQGGGLSSKNDSEGGREGGNQGVWWKGSPKRNH